MRCSTSPTGSSWIVSHLSGEPRDGDGRLREALRRLLCSEGACVASEVASSSSPSNSGESSPSERALCPRKSRPPRAAWDLRMSRLSARGRPNPVELSDLLPSIRSSAGFTLSSDAVVLRAQYMALLTFLGSSAFDRWLASLEKEKRGGGGGIFWGVAFARFPCWTIVEGGHRLIWLPRSGLAERGRGLMLSSELRLREGIRCFLVPGLVERFRSKVPFALRATKEQTRQTCCCTLGWCVA
jgi:hypothetical protein